MPSHLLSRLHDYHNHQPNHNEDEEESDGHMHSGSKVFPIGQQHDRGINGHHSENLFTKELDDHRIVTLGESVITVLQVMKHQ